MDQLRFAKQILATMQPEKFHTTLRLFALRAIENSNASMRVIAGRCHTQCCQASDPLNSQNEKQIAGPQDDIHLFARCCGTKFWQSILCEVFLGDGGVTSNWWIDRRL